MLWWSYVQTLGDSSDTLVLHKFLAKDYTPIAQWSRLSIFFSSLLSCLFYALCFINYKPTKIIAIQNTANVYWELPCSAHVQLLQGILVNEAKRQNKSVRKMDKVHHCAMRRLSYAAHVAMGWRRYHLHDPVSLVSGSSWLLRSFK